MTVLHGAVAKLLLFVAHGTDVNGKTPDSRDAAPNANLQQNRAGKVSILLRLGAVAIEMQKPRMQPGLLLLRARGLALSLIQASESHAGPNAILVVARKFFEVARVRPTRPARTPALAFCAAS
jgi:hypothetical protein